MPGIPIQLLIVADMIARLSVMAPPTYRYTFHRVVAVKENELTLDAESVAAIWSGNVRYLNAGMQGVAVTGNKLMREMPFVVLFVFEATATDPTDPASVDRDEECVYMFADIHKCLAAMDHQVVANTAVEIFFEVDVKDLSTIAMPKVYGEVHGLVRFRHNLGDFTTHT